MPDTSISITGTIKDVESLEDLVTAIDCYKPLVDWGGPQISSEAEARSLIAETVASGAPLNLYYDVSTSFSRLTETCRNIGLAYVLSEDVDEEYSMPGRTEVYRPDTQQVISVVGSDLAEGVMIPVKDMMPLIQAGKTDELVEMIRSAADISHGLPKSLSAAPELVEELNRERTVPLAR